MKRIKMFSVLIAIGLIISACSSGTTPTPTNAEVATIAEPPATSAPVEPTTAAPTTAATEVTTTSPTEMSSPTVAATPVATIPPDKLVQKTKLTICTDFPYPPQEFFDENGNPQGMDIEIGIEIGKRLGLQTQFVNSIFDTIIAAVTSGKCDIIISAQNITTDRKKEVSMIPYFTAGQAFVALKGNPQNINTTDDLCGKAVAAESGTTEAANLQGTGDYTGKGLTQKCKQAGKPEIKVVVTQKDTDALQQLQSGKVAVYFTDSPVAAYYTVQHPDQFQLVGQVLETVPEGISVPCGEKDCTNAPLSPTGQAVETALKSMIADGAYLQILNKWNLSSGAVKLP
ncbi:MAG: ABC transporter substrate-binding protein [Anaerolineaceae bacterium]|nr:ABC transporter substrate-binding protein [Anaerolineaceae bacterium]